MTSGGMILSRALIALLAALPLAILSLIAIRPLGFPGYVALPAGLLIGLLVAMAVPRNYVSLFRDRAVLWALIAVLVSPALLFFLWMLSLSLKPEIDNTSYPPVFIPTTLAWKNYVQVFEKNNFALFFGNSIIVTGLATLLALLVGVPAGYGVARLKATRWAIVVLIARMTPGLSYLIPLALLFKLIGLNGKSLPDWMEVALSPLPDFWISLHGFDVGLSITKVTLLLPQILIHLVITVPIVIWIMIGYFEGTPRELEEAAVIDGATRWQVFRTVALPIALPGVTIAMILAFIFSWNNFVFGVILGGRETRTLPVAVYNMISFEEINWGPLAAAALVVTLPVLLLTIFAQRQIIAGLTAGAVKGG
jgi:multiple sugar transport system permease protein